MIGANLYLTSLIHPQTTVFLKLSLIYSALIVPIQSIAITRIKLCVDFNSSKHNQTMEYNYLCAAHSNFK